ncbi:MAG: DevR family CRISPR-associated autoregulator [bacterium]|nr:DevR family CRISPR-associated autoregulator [bacterium]
MLKFVSFAVKMQLNVHDLNNEAVAGNVTDIRIIDFLDENGERKSAPAVSGRMLKHWHYEGIRKLALDQKLALCDACRIGEPARPGKLSGETLSQIKPTKITDEIEFVKRCPICDIHGYLIAQENKGTSEEETEENKPKEKTKGVSLRRNSRAMFSWLMPCLSTQWSQNQVLHTRVSQQETVAKGEQPSQMIFNKSYASGIYGFVSALDIERIGLVEINLATGEPYAIDDDQRKQRAKIAIEAYKLMASGQIGASLSHALPHNNPLEILVVYSETKPLPFLVSPIYSNYIEKSIGMMVQDATFLYWGTDSPHGVIKKESIDEIFSELLSKV